LKKQDRARADVRWVCSGRPEAYALETSYTNGNLGTNAAWFDQDGAFNHLTREKNVFEFRSYSIFFTTESFTFEQCLHD
jgi:hypothetical protein